MEGVHLIFDGNATAYRANVVTELSTSQGFRTSAIMGTLNIIQSTIKQLKTNYHMPIKNVIFVWDSGHSPRRKELYPEYKAGRRAQWTPEDEQWMKEFYQQIDILHENLCYLGVKSYKQPHWEGDDLVWGFIHEINKQFPDDLSVIVSTDEDFHQLIDDNVHVFSPIKKIMYNKSNYKKLTGIDSDKYLFYKILKGDPSDSIPGISGIGEKTAKSLVNKYGTLDNLFEHKDELMASKRLSKIYTHEGLSILDRNNKLINLKDYVDLVPIQNDIQHILNEPSVVNQKELKQFLMRYQLVSILTKLKSWIEVFTEITSLFNA